MDVFLSLTAITLLVVSGFGASSLIMPRFRTTSVIELLSLSVLFGATIVSSALFFFGIFFSHPTLLWIVTSICISFGLVGLAVIRGRRLGLSIAGIRNWQSALAILAITLQFAVVVWLTVRQTLGWDGVFVWEIKARLAFLNNGTIPVDYYNDSSRMWTHPEYPPFLPLVEAWIYAWLGHPNQGLVKIIFPCFYITAIGLLYSACSRLRGMRSLGFVAAVFPFFVPTIITGFGASSGYADIPIAVFYLACVIYLVEYLETHETSILCLVGALAAVLPLVKRDGIILLLCVMLVFLATTVRRRQIRVSLVVCLPALVTVCGWQVFLSIHGLRSGTDFLDITFANLWNNLGRTLVMGTWMVKELTDWKTWGWLWPLYFVSLLIPKSEIYRRHRLALITLVILPIVLYTGTLFFSAWPSFIDHVNFSLPRLMLQTSFIIIFGISLALPDKIVCFGYGGRPQA